MEACAESGSLTANSITSSLENGVHAGNYKGYYRKRDDALSRMDHFQEDWFIGRTCLDVGCNEGTVTVEVAKRFSPRMIIGVDGDGLLIDAAKSKVKRLQFSAKSAPLQPIEPQSVGLPRFHNQFPQNIAFTKKDVMTMEQTASSRYDTILCLSVTKWIHLSGGDDALLQLFRSFYALLKPDGILILEYQPWRSYIKRKKSNKSFEDTFNTITIKPADFEDVLRSRFSFELIAKFGDEATSTGFDRPILVLRKIISDTKT